jgi:hypothetical protein
MSVKRIILTFFVLLTVATLVRSAPFLVCDETTEDVEEYVVVIDGDTTIVAAEAVTDSTVRLKFDLAALPSGNHTVSMATRNMWGDSPFVPFAFRSGIPAGPTGIGLER